MYRFCDTVASTKVATVLTACGIETCFAEPEPDKFNCCNSTYRLRYWNELLISELPLLIVVSCNSTYRLRYWNSKAKQLKPPFVVLASCNSTYRLRYWNWIDDFDWTKMLSSCNSTYRLRYWNMFKISNKEPLVASSCNSTYRLRYWNMDEIWSSLQLFQLLQQYLPLAVLKPN